MYLLTNIIFGQIATYFSKYLFVTISKVIVSYYLLCNEAILSGHQMYVKMLKRCLLRQWYLHKRQEYQYISEDKANKFGVFLLAKASSWTLAMGSWGSRGPLRKTGSCWGRCDQADPYGQLQALAGEARRVQQPLSCRLVRKFSFIYPENAHHRGKYYYTVDLLFDWFGFDQTSKTVVHST